jgi:hypothetical protein
VLKVLRQVYSPVKLTLAYKEEEANWLTDVNHQIRPPTKCSQTVATAIAMQVSYKLFCNTCQCQTNVTLDE